MTPRSSNRINSLALRTEARAPSLPYRKETHRSLTIINEDPHLAALTTKTFFRKCQIRTAPQPPTNDPWCMFVGQGNAGLPRHVENGGKPLSTSRRRLRPLSGPSNTRRCWRARYDRTLVISAAIRCHSPSTRRRCSSRISSAMLVRKLLMRTGFVERIEYRHNLLAIFWREVHLP
jgi:hypothetical protein